MKHIFLALTLLASFHLAAAQHDKPKGNTGEGVGTALPGFAFELPDGGWLTPRNLPPNQPVIVFYFDPFCDHCQQEAEWITSQKELFKGITLLWVSWGEMKDIAAFPQKYLPGVTGSLFFTRDSKFEFDNYFGYSEIPSIYVYNKNWLRTASFKAEAKPEILVKFARKTTP